MRKRILEGIAGIGLLAVLPACSTQKQAIMPEDVYAVARTVQTGTEQEAGSDKQQGQISRNVEIPQSVSYTHLSSLKISIWPYFTVGWDLTVSGRLYFLSV